MIIDKDLEFSLAQSIVGNSGTIIPSDHSADRGAVVSFYGIGEDEKLFVQIGTAILGASGGVKIDYIQSDNADLSAPDVLVSVTTAATAAGSKIVDQVVPKNTKRYVGVQYTPLSSNCTQGTVNAWIVKNPDAQVAYPSGFSVS